MNGIAELLGVVFIDIARVHFSTRMPVAFFFLAPCVNYSDGRMESHVRAFRLAVFVCVYVFLGICTLEECFGPFFDIIDIAHSFQCAHDVRVVAFLGYLYFWSIYIRREANI